MRLDDDRSSEDARGAAVEECGDWVCGRSVGRIREVGGRLERGLVLAEIEGAGEMGLEVRAGREGGRKGRNRWTKVKHRAVDTGSARERECR